MGTLDLNIDFLWFLLHTDFSDTKVGESLGTPDLHKDFLWLLLHCGLKRDLLPLALSLVGGSQVIKEFAVHLHERLEHVVDERHYRLVPVLLADAVQCREHNWHDHLIVLLHQTHYVLVIPEV